MGTTIRAEVSKKNPYWIERHRYYELKHFCLQYPIWKQSYASLGFFASNSNNLNLCRNHYHMSNPTERISMVRASLSEKMRMVERAAEESDPELSQYILIGVTEGVSYDIIRVRYNIPCCKDVYYETYRRFFWLLNKIRD